MCGDWFGVIEKGTNKQQGTCAGGWVGLKAVKRAHAWNGANSREEIVLAWSGLAVHHPLGRGVH